MYATKVLWAFEDTRWLIKAAPDKAIIETAKSAVPTIKLYFYQGTCYIKEKKKKI